MGMRPSGGEVLGTWKRLLIPATPCVPGRLEHCNGDGRESDDAHGQGSTYLHIQHRRAVTQATFLDQTFLRAYRDISCLLLQRRNGTGSGRGWLYEGAGAFRTDTGGHHPPRRQLLPPLLPAGDVLSCPHPPLAPGGGGLAPEQGSLQTAVGTAGDSSPSGQVCGYREQKTVSRGAGKPTEGYLPV